MKPVLEKRNIEESGVLQGLVQQQATDVVPG